MNSIIKKIIRFIDNTIDRIILIVFILVFLVGCYGMYDVLCVYNEAQDKSFLKFKPSNRELLTAELEGNVAWLTLDDSTIDYPIMQGENETDYLNTDPYGKYSLSGSIFLDHRNNEEFTDIYNLVYGRHMENDMMFGGLDKWLEEDYFYSHTTGTLTTKNHIYSLRVFAVADTNAERSELFQPVDVSGDVSIAYILNHSLLLDASIIPTHVLALSTCKYPNTNERTMVFCQMEMLYEGKNTELDQTKKPEVAQSDLQYGTKVYKNIQPLKPNKTFLDSFLTFIGIK